MSDALAKTIRETLEGGRAGAAVFLLREGDGLMPHVARDASDPLIDKAYGGDERYPMATFAAVLQPRLEGSLAVVARECDRRMFIELAKFNHLDLDRIVIIGLPCSQALADACACDHPTPAESVLPALAQPVVSAEDGLPETVPERLEFWMDNFKECIRCYGCRNVCPLCFCKECALDKEDLTGTGVFPPDIPVFHIIRALDMADRCIDCGMCENVCPAKIPLRTLYRQMRRLVKETFGYEPGLDVNEKSPFGELGDPERLGGVMHE